MRFVKKDLEDIPPTLIKTEVLSALQTIATTGNKALIKDTIFKGEFIEKGEKRYETRTYLHKYYHKKCAYCEMRETKPEIEHYRPKKSVTGTDHNGYYWLCYEWSNLIPSCRYCNTEGGKVSQFPIMGKRVYKPTLINDTELDVEKNIAKNAPLIDEKPYLLHPEIDIEFDSFLAFKINDKKAGIDIEGIDDLKRGEETIKICNLNRENVKVNRLEAVYQPFKEKLIGIFDAEPDDSHLFRFLNVVFIREEEKSKDETKTHTLLRKFIVHNVDTFSQHFAPYLDNEKQRTLVVEAFKRYKNGTLHKLF